VRIGGYIPPKPQKRGLNMKNTIKINLFDTFKADFNQNILNLIKNLKNCKIIHYYVDKKFIIVKCDDEIAEILQTLSKIDCFSIERED
jgi:hypothetical protein